jgi:hypothetical protein
MAIKKGSSRVMHGARAILSIDDGTGPKVVGIFQEVSWGMILDEAPVFILGRSGPAEIVTLGQQPVQINLSAFKVPKHGAHKEMKFPTLANLLDAEDVTVAIHDRQNDDPDAVVMRAHGCRPTSYQTGLGAKRLQELQVSFVGTSVDEDDVQNEERGDAADLPPAE